MVNILKAMEAKSDQLNAVDLLGGPRTIKIRDVSENKDGRVCVYFDGDDGKPWILSKTALRMLAPFWGVDEKKWIGLHCTIYNDPTVKWAGEEVGGIRVSHVEGISKARTITVPVTRGVRKKVTIEPLKIESESKADQWKDRLFSVTENPDITVDEAWKKTPKDIQKELGGQDFYEQLIEMEKASQKHTESDDAVVDDLNAQFAEE